MDFVRPLRPRRQALLPRYPDALSHIPLAATTVSDLCRPHRLPRPPALHQESVSGCRVEKRLCMAGVPGSSKKKRRPCVHGKGVGWNHRQGNGEIDYGFWASEDARSPSYSSTDLPSRRGCALPPSALPTRQEVLLVPGFRGRTGEVPREPATGKHLQNFPQESHGRITTSIWREEP